MPRLVSILIAAAAFPYVGLCGSAAGQNAGGGAAPRQERAAAPNRDGGGAQPAAPQMTTERLLTLWERQSQRLKDLKLSIYRVDRTPAWDEEIHYDGSAAFKNPQLAFLHFNKIKTKVVPDPRNPKKNKVEDVIDSSTGRRASTPYERIVCTGKEVWQYRFDKVTAYVYPLNKEAQRRGLDEGPLPFLFNMKAEDALARYQMSLQGETPRVYFVVIKPKLKEDKESFSTAFVQLDRKFLLPLRITLFSPDNQSIRDFTLSNIEANQGVSNVVFRGGKFDDRWTVERNPSAEEEGEAPRVAPRRNAARQGAQRAPGLER